MTFEDFEPLLSRAHAHAHAFLGGLPQRFVGARAGREEMMAALDAPLSRHGEDPAAVLDLLARNVERGASACAAPRYFGFVIGGSLPVALAADWLVSTWDQNAGIHVISPIAAAMEEIAARWLLDLFDLPRESSVGFVTGCQMAHFTCLAAARHGVLRRAGWDVETDGLNGAPRVHVVASQEAHITVDVALRYLGFGTSALVHVESDAQGRMRADRLREILPALQGPVIVCAQAGNVNTGAFDPLREIADATRVHGGWLHVDGAFGLWSRASTALHAIADGIELADSWATDAHKWLNVPYDSGVAIVRNSTDHHDAMTSAAAYLVQTRGAERDAVDWVPEFSRRARGIPVYAALRALGHDGVADLVDRCCARARQFADRLSVEPGVTILTDVVLNQVLVRFGDEDELTRDVIAGVQADGTCWAGGTTWHGLAAMRISVSNWATSEDDVNLSTDAMLRVYRSLREKRAAASSR